MPRKNRRTRSKSIRRSNRRSVRRSNRRSVRRTNRRKSLRRSNRRRTTRRNVDEKYGGSRRASRRAGAWREGFGAKKEKAARDKEDKENNLRSRALELSMPGAAEAKIGEVESFLKKVDALDKEKEQSESRLQARKERERELEELRERANELRIDGFENKGPKQLRKGIKQAEEKLRKEEEDRALSREATHDEIMDNLQRLRDDIRELNNNCGTYGGVVNSDRTLSFSQSDTDYSEPLEPGGLADSDTSDSGTGDSLVDDSGTGDSVVDDSVTNSTTLGGEVDGTRTDSESGEGSEAAVDGTRTDSESSGVLDPGDVADSEGTSDSEDSTVTVSSTSDEGGLDDLNPVATVSDDAEAAAAKWATSGARTPAPQLKGRSSQ